MTQADTEVDVQDIEVPPEADEGEDPSGQDTEPSTSSEPSPRERELERRLTEQGRKLADTQRTLTTTVSRLETSLQSLTDNLSRRDKADADRREAEREAYLKTLPADQRALKKVELLEAEIKSLKNGEGRTDAQPARTATPPTEDPEVAYMRQQATAIIKRANTKYGVELTREQIGTLPESAWEDEHAFHDAVYELAEQTSKSGEGTMAGKGKTEETSEERTRRIVRSELGTSSPAAPRAAAPKGKKPTEEDVKEIVGTYSSQQGPRASIAKLKEARARMG